MLCNFFFINLFFVCMKRADLIVISLPMLTVAVPETQGDTPGYQRAQ